MRTQQLKYCFSFVLFLSSSALYSQDSLAVLPKWKEKFSVNGYIKLLNSASFTKLDTIHTNNFFHNRINFKVFPAKSLTLGLEVRNRLFYGESVKLDSLFSEKIGRDNGLVDMSFVLVDEPSMVLHSQIDRAYINYTKNKWDIRIGRQRINWGINMAWNTNDLFNAYNLVDFDYIERPGTDAVRIQYYAKALASFEIAVKPENHIDKSVIAALYKFNIKPYDFQVLAANYFTDFALGCGWAGNLKNSGFKGEATYFHPKERWEDTLGSFTVSTSLDYSFKKGIYVNASYLYNSLGSNSFDAIEIQQFSSTNLSAKMLMPSRHAFFVSTSGTVNSTVSLSLAAIYLPGFNLTFLMPGFEYNIKENWDLSLVGQLYFGEVQSAYKNIGNSVFLRFIFSY